MPVDVMAKIRSAPNHFSREWLKHIFSLGQSPHTIVSYRGDLAVWFGHLDVTGRELGSADYLFVHDWIRKLRQGGNCIKTVQRKVCSLKAFYTWLKRAGHVASNPFLEIDKLKAPKRIPEVLTRGEVDRLIAAGSIVTGRKTTHGLRNKAILETLYGTGCRLSEARRLDVDDIRFDTGQVRLLGKGNKERLVPISPAAIRAIKEYLPHREDGWNPWKKERIRALFVSEREERLSNDSIQEVVENAGLKSGLSGKRIHAHLLRHSYATHLLNAGVDLVKIRDILGHSSIVTTQVYTQVSTDHLTEAVLKVKLRE